MTDTESILNGGECGELIRGYDWSATSLGPISSWSEGFVSVVNTVLNSPLAYVLMCGPDGVLVYNDAYARFSIDRHPDILGKTVMDAWPEIGEYNMDIIQRVHAGETISYEDQYLQLRRSSKLDDYEDVYLNMTYSPVYEEGGRICAVNVSVIDTTQRLVAYETLSKLQNDSKIASEVFDSVVDSIPDFVYYFDREKKFQYANRAVLKMVNVQSPKDIIGKGLEAFFTPAIADKVGREIDTVFADGTPLDSTLTLQTKDTTFELEYTLSPVYGTSKEVAYVSGISRDITEKLKLIKVQYEADKLTTERELLLKMNGVKDDFISVASHELRTPATGVKQFIEMVLEGFVGKVEPKQRTLLEKADRINNRQIQIIDDILSVARIDSNNVNLTLQPVDIGNVLTDLVEYYTPLFLVDGQKLRLKKPDSAMLVNGDEGNLRIAITNIIENARKYSQPGGRTVITVKEGNNVVITIKDTGVGVKKAELDKLFTKFQRLPNEMSVKTGGVGLGLYWSREILRLHDGTIKARLNTPSGMVFTICLPLVSDAK